MSQINNKGSVVSLCVESSHQRGMGHLYRALTLLEYLSKVNERCILVVNNDLETVRYLEGRNIPFVVRDYSDITSNWETKIIRDYSVHTWINDRLNTDQRHAENVKSNDVRLVTFDDRGEGARWADINFAPLNSDDRSVLHGKKVLKGIEYLMLNNEIEKYRRLRRSGTAMLVTLGGSDTYDVTLMILRSLKRLNIPATLHLGPLFNSERQLEKEVNGSYPVIRGVPSLIKEMYRYDLAITGGGITPYEANASGLPCLMVSSEDHESSGCRYLDSIGSSCYLGSMDCIDAEIIKETLDKIDIEKMSKLGMEKIGTSGAETVWKKIKELDNE